MQKLVPLAVVFILSSAALPAQDGPVQLLPPEVQQIRSRLVPDGPATYETIPWELDLLRARSKALRAGKRLFLWSMNGHPLGCV